MCLGVPGKILEIYTKLGLRMAKIDFDGAIREACVETLPEAQVGDYTIIHAGFALNILSEEDALSNLALLREMAAIGAEDEEYENLIGSSGDTLSPGTE